ncbi:hypothetical protein B484DRAFT_417822, partial [Ochromonadaceae sp. CCMP2298]
MQPHSSVGGLELSSDCFPLLLLSYVDLLEMSDAVALLAAQLPQAVLVFAPDFLLETLAVRIKMSLDRWCKPPSTADSNPSSGKHALTHIANNAKGRVGSGGSGGRE